MPCQRPLSSPLAGRPQTQDAVGQAEHEGDHQHAVDQRLVLLQRVQQLEGEDQQKGADDRSGDEVETAQEAVQHEVDRIRNRVAGRIDVLLEGREEAPPMPPMQQQKAKAMTRYRAMSMPMLEARSSFWRSERNTQPRRLLARRQTAASPSTSSTQAST